MLHEQMLISLLGGWAILQMSLIAPAHDIAHPPFSQNLNLVAHGLYCGCLQFTFYHDQADVFLKVFSVTYRFSQNTILPFCL